MLLSGGAPLSSQNNLDHGFDCTIPKIESLDTSGSSAKDIGVFYKILVSCHKTWVNSNLNFFKTNPFS